MDVLPILWAMSLGPLLNLSQFQAFMSLIKSLSARIEAEHTRKLQELSATKASSANRADFMSSLAPTTRGPALDFDAANGDVDDFESLVLGRGKANANSNNMLEDWSTSSSSTANATATTRPSLSSRQSASSSSAAATFAWSSTPTSPPTSTSMNTTLRPHAPQQQVSRSVTPDQSLSSFAPLRPQTSSTGMSSYNSVLTPSQPSQPLRPGMQTQTSTPAGGIDWSHAASSGAGSSANVWSSPSPAMGGTFTTSTPMMHPPIGSNTGTSNIWATNPSTIPPQQQSRSPYSGFGIAPPPLASPSPSTSMSGMGVHTAPNAGTMGGFQRPLGVGVGVNGSGGGLGYSHNQNQGQGQSQGLAQGQMGQKMGMDKYESLL